MREGRRVLVTGLGVVSPLSNDLAAFWEGLLHRPTVPVERVFRGIPDDRIAQRLVYDFGPEGSGASGPPQRLASTFALDAATAALADAGLSDAHLASTIVGVSIGSAMGDQDAFEGDPVGAVANAEFNDFAHATSLLIAERFDLGGPNFQVNTACASGGYSISMARDVIASGEADIMIAGGAESISHVPVACFNRLRALDPLACRPFDADRQGTMGGCGAAILILESETSWRARGCPPVYAEARGAGWSCDGYNVTAPEPTAHHLKLALMDALSRSAIDAQDVDCVVAHGTGTRLNDVAESKAITEVLHGAGPLPIVYAPKSKLGHSGGASTAFSCAAASLIISHGLVPPTANLRLVDRECDLRFALSAPVECDVRHLVVNGYGFGGNNISMVFSKFAG